MALVGDAAAAFLPIAGIGASMALESAAVLADELSRTDAAHLVNALDFYVKRRFIRVVAAQNQSRRLARVVFIRSRALGLSVAGQRVLAPILAPSVKDGDGSSNVPVLKMFYDCLCFRQSWSTIAPGRQVPPSQKELGPCRFRSVTFD